MTSDEARDLFGDALEGTLDTAQKTALEAALASDVELLEEYEAYRTVVSGAQSLGARVDSDDPGSDAPDLLAGVQGRLRRRSRGRFYRDQFSQQAGPRSALPVLVAIVVALTLAAAWVALQSFVVIDPPAAASPAEETAEPHE